MSLDDIPRCWPQLYEPEWTPTNGVPTFALCVQCGRGTVRRDLHGIPHCHGPLPPEPEWMTTRGYASVSGRRWPVIYVNDSLAGS